MDRYAAMLQIFREGCWQTIRLIDNAHNEHHMHRYAGDIKRDAVSVETGDTRDVLPKWASLSSCFRQGRTSHRSKAGT